ncbi:MAG TPA: hypothetical protein VEW07_03965 [Solirubrobacterales bacterium]|nr:hypothetical protein [Solirubrobacterales bacterium]
MNLARTLAVLWRRRVLVAVGVLVAAVAATLSVSQVSLAPPSLESRANVFAAASSEMLVDTPDSAVADVNAELTPLSTRAEVFTRFLTSTDAVDRIAAVAGVPADALEARGPFQINLPEAERVPTAEERSSQIIGEDAVYRLRFESPPELPLITAFSQAPTEDEAVALAAAVPRVLQGYVRAAQRREQTPPARRVTIRELGQAEGAVVNEGAGVQIAVLVFLTVLVGWCMLLIPAHTIARGWREIDPEDEGFAPGPHRNGHGSAQHVPPPRQPEKAS